MVQTEHISRTEMTYGNGSWDHMGIFSTSHFASFVLLMLSFLTILRNCRKPIWVLHSPLLLSATSNGSLVVCWSLEDSILFVVNFFFNFFLLLRSFFNDFFLIESKGVASSIFLICSLLSVLQIYCHLTLINELLFFLCFKMLLCKLGHTNLVKNINEKKS